MVSKLGCVASIGGKVFLGRDVECFSSMFISREEGPI